MAEESGATPIELCYDAMRDFGLRDQAASGMFALALFDDVGHIQQCPLQMNPQVVKSVLRLVWLTERYRSSVTVAVRMNGW